METIQMILNSDLFFGFWSPDMVKGVAYMVAFALSCEVFYRKIERIKQLNKIQRKL